MTPTDLQTTVHGNTAFAIALYHELRTTEGNLFFSPYSISAALAMTYAGARGETAAQMARALRFALDDEALHAAFGTLRARLETVGKRGHVQLRIANALWPQQGYPLLEAFLALLVEHYDARVTTVDYGQAEEARRTINAWVEDQTEGKIVDLIPRGLLDGSTRLVLVNGIYFKGDWASQFDPDLTRDEPFWVAPDTQVQVPMMGQAGTFRHGRGDGVQVLELPYAGDDLSMVVLLPEEVEGLGDLEARLTAENLSGWTGNLRKGEVAVVLPRFEITLPFRLDGALQSLGVVDAFGDADFAGMDGTTALYLAAVLHKAFIAVDEEGTEAAAATAVVTVLKAPPMPALVFRADHPFLFLIRESDTGSVLFLGRVVKPPAPPGSQRTPDRPPGMGQALAEAFGKT